MKNFKYTFSFAFLIILLFATPFYANTLNNSRYSDLSTITEKTFKISPGKNLYLKTDAGSINLRTWDKSEVYVKILGNDKAKDKMKFNFDNNDNEVKIIGKKKSSGFFGMFSFSGVNLRYEIMVPKSFNLKINTAGGNIKVADLDGENKLNTSGGNIDLSDINGNIRASTSGGNIRLNNTVGVVDVSTSGGNIDAQSFNGDFKGITSGGNINLKGSNSRIIAETSGGSVYGEYSGENKGIKLETSGGEVTLKVPKQISADVNLSTSGGSVSCDLTMSDIHKSSHSSLRGKVNGGGKEIRLESSGGNVSLEGL